MHQNQKIHVPVLLNEVLAYLDPKVNDAYLDLTAGYGGHAESVLERTLAPTKAVLVDRDEQAVNYLKGVFKGSKVRLINQDFFAASKQLLANGQSFDVILADLGVSSLHLNTASRGFSIRQNGPLDMRMYQGQDLTAAHIVNGYSEKELAELIFKYGEEKHARKIAHAIVENRPLTSTQQLANLVAEAYGNRYRKIHPATKTFQALRIAVNDELELLKTSLPIWIKLLNAGGRLVIISFHSLEDRVVKQILAKYAGNRYDAEITLLTKKPVTGSKQEIDFNPRARSAKLRAAVKIKKQERRD